MPAEANLAGIFHGVFKSAEKIAGILQIPSKGAMKLTAQVLYEFDKFRLNPAEQLLLCDDKPVPLTPKAFQILCVLLQSKGRLLDKDDLIKRVWPNSFVEEANLSVNISALRKALGDTPNGQKFIATVPKRGYRFVMPVHEIQGVSQTETKPEDLVGIV